MGALYYYFKSKEALLDARIDGLNTELAEWITAWASPLPRQECVFLAAVGVNNILGIRFTTSFVPPVRSAGVRRSLPHRMDGSPLASGSRRRQFDVVL
ncbi:MAG: hypothetical protein ACRDUX_24770 [Mycobacterium sp.]